jgi:serine/threonine protein kinase
VSGGGESVGVGDVLGDFRIIQQLGKGGMGVVFLAEDERLERKVALKVIAPELARDGDFRKRFTAEARSAAAIDHPNAVTVYSSGTVDGELYMAMRFINGTDLRTYLRENGPLDPEAAVAVLTEVAAALDTAHAVGLVHRDVKPANILLDGEPGEGKAYLTDFGLTKGRSGNAEVQLTGTGQWVGTIDYVAPEQIRAGTIDARTDVYALACVLYESVTGRVPFTGNEMQKMWGHVNEPFPALDGDEEPAKALGAVIERATAKDPDDRFPSAGDLARAAAAALEGTEVETPERSVATGAAAEGLSEAAPTKKLQAPGMAPTVAGRSPLPRPSPAARRPVPPPPPQAPAPQPHSGGSSNSTRTAAIIGAAVVISAGLLAAAVVIAGQDSSPTASTQTATSTPNEPNTADRELPTQPNPPRGAPPSGLPADARPCEAGVGVWVRTLTTSCVFGLNVAAEYRRSGGASRIEAYSPKTGTTYLMTCDGSSLITCTGGNDAAVYIEN